MNKRGLFILFIFISATVSAKDYSASLFGIKSNGTTNNTSSIQKAIDYISERGGGNLVFYVGRYLTGTIHLKGGVFIRLEEGAVLTGSSSPYDYKNSSGPQALIVADGQSNIGISGKGVLLGSGNILAANAQKLIVAGYLKNAMRPGLVAFSNCTNVSINGLNLWNTAYTAISLTKCKNIKIDAISIDGKNLPSSVGIFLENCKWITMEDLYIRVMQKPIITVNNEDVKIQNSRTNKGIPLTASRI